MKQTNFFDEMLERLPAENREAYTGSDQIILILDGFINVLPSFVAIFAFLLSGISFKVFSSVVSRVDDTPENIYVWRFVTGNVFAYFYIVLALISIFATTDDPFGIVCVNLYNLFMVVYAYIGFNFAKALISIKKSPRFANILLILLILFTSGLAFTILSYVGVYFTIARNKALNSNNGNNGTIV